MNLFKRILFSATLIVLGMTGKAYASCSSSVPYVFVATSPLSYVTTNANNNYLNACVTNVDNTQIGAAGLYASQMKPTNSSQATFGGSQGYTFPSSLLANGYISSAQGTYKATNGGGSQLDFNVSNPGEWTFNAPLTVTGFESVSGQMNAGSIVDNSTLSVSGTSTLTGAVSAPGGVSTSTLGAGTSITDSGPLNVAGTINANATGTSISVAGNINISGTTTTTGVINANGGVSTSTLGVGTSITNNGPLNNGGTINANNTGTSITAAGSENISGNATIGGTSNLNGPLNANAGVSTSTLGAGTSITDSGPLNVAGTINANATGTSIQAQGDIHTLGTVSSNIVTSNVVNGITGGTVSQTLPFIIGGSAINNQGNAHAEIVTVPTSGTYSFTKPFDFAPTCLSAIVSSTTNSTYTTTGSGTFMCAGS